MSIEDHNTVDLKSLSTKRSNIKGRLTKFKNHVEHLQTLENVSELEINKLAMKLSRIEALFLEFDELQNQIECFNESNRDQELNTRDVFEQDFDHYICIAQDLIKANSPSKIPGFASCPSSDLTNKHSNCPNVGQCNSETLGFKLPIIKIPNFDGTYFKWLEFKETFSSLVHENTQIKNIYKFHYLNSYLEGEAARVICNLEVTDKNYCQAWKLLCERFDNKRQLINNHLRSLLNIETVRETAKSLRFIIDHVTKNLRALSTLGLPTDKWDVLIIHMVTAKLDNTTCFKWEEFRNNVSEIPTLTDFFTFLKNRADVLETVYESKLDRQNKTKPGVTPTSFNKVQQTKSFAVTTSSESSQSPAKSFECSMCKGDHRLYECSAFKSKSPKDRNSIVKSLKLCENCLKPGHKVEECKLVGSCRSCKRRHNSLLHSPSYSDAPTSSQTVVMSSTQTSTNVLLCTAKVQISNPVTKNTMTIKALLDSGSQSSFITNLVKQKLNLTPLPAPNVSIVGIGNTSLNVNVERCAINLQSNTNPFNVTMYCLCLPQISDNIPKVAFDTKHLNLPKCELADPSFNVPSPIDMLIGADLFWDLIGSEQRHLEDYKTILRSSKLGWLVAGTLPTVPKQLTPNKTVVCNFLLKNFDLNCSSNNNLEHLITKFWELESVPSRQPYSKEESQCEQHFLSTTTRLTDGRFCVGLPLHRDRDLLGDSYQLARKDS